MEKYIPRIMIAGTGSGSGKTTITCGILRALQQRGTLVTSFKCGPDYIDPMFHSEVIGTKSRNIDLFLCGEEESKFLFAKNSQELGLSLVEGVMGFYDGMGGNSEINSSYDISRKLGIPTILVVDGKGASLSVAATIQGFQNFMPNNIKGVILNRVSGMMMPFYRTFIKEYTGLEVLGCMPKDDTIVLESRHLGLVTAKEMEDLTEKIDRMGILAGEHIDLDRLLEIAKEAEPLEYEAIEIEQVTKKPVKIAVAKDKASCFYYEDSLELLEEMGAQLVPFSPLEDQKLPEGISGLILGGGYPELYLEKLSGNQSMIESIQKASENHMPIYAECGGFMYLGDAIGAYPMCGIIPMKCEMTKRLQNFGYINLIRNQENTWIEEREVLKAHEFHYSKSDRIQFDLKAQKTTGKQWETGYITDEIFAGYPHMHLWGQRIFARKWMEKVCLYSS